MFSAPGSEGKLARIGNRRISKRLAILASVVLFVLVGASSAYAADALPFFDIQGHWAEQAIINVAARGIILGHEDGTFGPDQYVTPAQVATFLDRLHTEEFTAVDARRGCPDCHAGTHTLKAEAVNAAADVHAALADDADVTACLDCHAPGTGDRAGKGNVAPISLMDIVHPVHMGSKIFTIELMGNCFSCHNVSGDGVFQVLTQAVDTDAKGIPDTLPIPGAINP